MNLETWLQQFLERHQGTAATVHLVENDGLRLATAINIPPPVRQIVEWVPKGKGMAGLAFERNEPVHTCNLKEDTSGNVKPGARAVNAQAAVALPVTDQEGSVVAVVGIAFSNEREFTQPELTDLMTSACTMRAAAVG
jgi:L-methionine (R)-S-oxide reductase